MLIPLLLSVLAAFAPSTDCRARRALGPPSASAVLAVVVISGEDDPNVAAGVTALGANTIATLTPPRFSTGAAAVSAGLGYLPRISPRDVDRLLFDGVYLAAVRAIPGITGFQYFDESVTEGYATPATQARAYGILKALFPSALALYATRLDPIATDPTYLDLYFRPEFTDMVTPYFYPVGTTVLGTQEEGDPWEERLRSLLAPLSSRIPSGKPVFPVLQAFEQIGHPVGGRLPARQLTVYREFWPDNGPVAAFWWGGEVVEPLLGMTDLPRLARGVSRLFGGAPSQPAPCELPARVPLQSGP